MFSSSILRFGLTCCSSQCTNPNASACPSMTPALPHGVLEKVRAALDKYDDEQEKLRVAQAARKKADAAKQRSDRWATKAAQSAASAREAEREAMAASTSSAGPSKRKRRDSAASDSGIFCTLSYSFLSSKQP